jgi:hypothetical protein
MWLLQSMRSTASHDFKHSSNMPCPCPCPAAADPHPSSPSQACATPPPSASISGALAKALACTTANSISMGGASMAWAWHEMKDGARCMRPAVAETHCAPAQSVAGRRAKPKMNHVPIHHSTDCSNTRPAGREACWFAHVRANMLTSSMVHNYGSTTTAKKPSQARCQKQCTATQASC